ncbi:MAG TPA: hypothetical protein VF618_22210 [Thermoanaerobaculia bacterium]
MWRLLALCLVLFAPCGFAQVRPDAADREAAVPNVLIPIAGEVAGAFGTRFQTDVTMANRTAVAARVAIFWLPQGRSGSITVPLRTLTLPPHSTTQFPRFVSETLGQTGLGAFIARAVNDDGTTNFSGRIDVYARIWSPAHTGQGTYSQGVYGTTLLGPGTDDLQPIHAFVYGLRQDANFRTNYGLVNLMSEPRGFTITVTGENGSSYARDIMVPGASMIHEPLPPEQHFGALTIEMMIHYVAPPQVSLPWAGFASSVDNFTGDAWYSKAQAAYRNNQP